MSFLNAIAQRLHLGNQYAATREVYVRLRVKAGTRIAQVETYPERREQIDNEHLHLLLKLMLRPDANCIDAGAHDGKFLADMVEAAPLGHHIAYEPLPDYASRLRGRFPNVDVREAAVCDTNGTTTFNYVSNIPSMSSLRPGKSFLYPRPPEVQQLTVRTERLDDHVPSGYVPSLIKVDVEGAQMLVFKGAEQTITAHRPIVIFEHGLLNAWDYEFT